jgi:hypothetical protein
MGEDDDLPDGVEILPKGVKVLHEFSGKQGGKNAKKMSKVHAVAAKACDN